MGFYARAVDICDPFGAQLDGPLRYPPCGVWISEYAFQRRLGDNNYRVRHEFVPKFSCSHPDIIGQLLVMRIMLFRRIQDFAEVVDGTLDAMNLAHFFSFND